MQAETIVEQAGTKTKGNGTQPFHSPVAAYLEELHARYARLDEGELATYIPELATASRDWFGICLVTVDGAVYEAGDARVPFTIQSISKPLTYGLVLEDNGEAAVRRHVGVEPTGEAFNSITLDPVTGAPFNPMVNAGAIAATSLVAERDGATPIERLLATYSRYAGRQLSLDDAVFRSESATGHRNRAIGHLLRNGGVIEHDPEPVLRRYFQQCSVMVDCRDLALVAATLANSGVNPATGERAALRDTVRRVLSVMTTCGMYDYAGEWLYTVGIPAKSGVSGGIMAVLPGQLGIGVFSPPLDARGNSVRGVRVCQDVARELDVHLVQAPARPASPVRAAHTVAERGSKRARSGAERAALRRLGGRAVSLELQGELTFATAEVVVRDATELAPSIDLIVFDLRRVARVDWSAMPLVADLARRLAAAGVRVALSGVERHARVVESVRAAMTRTNASPAVFGELDLALEWCENELLATAGAATEAVFVPLDEHELTRGLTPEQLTVLQPLVLPRRFAPGDWVVRAGEAADELFLVARGTLSVTLTLEGGSVRRLATVSAGMVLGELAVVGEPTRTADVRADTAVECYALPASELERLGRDEPQLGYTLHRNLLRIVSRNARRTNEELALLAG